jgi:ABC-type uncharacterized transport system auxiliary subunit
MRHFMKKKIVAISCVLKMLIVMCGCGAAKYPSYYTLHVPSPPDPPAQGNIHATLAVREFRSPGYLHQGAIVYKTSPEQIGFYNYQRWATDPREFVTNAVSDRLRAGGTFTQVKPYDGRADIDFVLSGRLEKLEEIDYDGGVKVEVEISAQIIKLSTGATIWADSVDEVGNVDKRDVPAVVAAMNRTMDQAIEKLVTPGPVVSNEQATTARRDAQ